MLLYAKLHQERVIFRMDVKLREMFPVIAGDAAEIHSASDPRRSRYLTRVMLQCLTLAHG